MSVNPEKIKAMGFQSRVKEAFKILRRTGMGARLGPAYDAERELKRKSPGNWCYMPVRDYQEMNSYGTRHGRIYCHSAELAEKVRETLRDHGIICAINMYDSKVVNMQGMDDNLIGTGETVKLTMEVLVETYTLD